MPQKPHPLGQGNTPDEDSSSIFTWNKSMILQRWESNASENYPDMFQEKNIRILPEIPESFEVAQKEARNWLKYLNGKEDDNGFV